ncbi:hypothetical protein Bbelb_329540 [Branchiostoma belcheri]|nr:hypothetical protein Bbelb_329540 [Branchiostoma belcheri]
MRVTGCESETHTLGHPSSPADPHRGRRAGSGWDACSELPDDLVTLKVRLDYASPPGAALVRQLKTTAVGVFAELTGKVASALGALFGRKLRTGILVQKRLCSSAETPTRLPELGGRSPLDSQRSEAVHPWIASAEFHLALATSARRPSTTG